MCNLQQIGEISIDAALFKTGNIPFQRSIFYQEKGNKITANSEKLQTWINNQILQQ